MHQRSASRRFTNLEVENTDLLNSNIQNFSQSKTGNHTLTKDHANWKSRTLLDDVSMDGKLYITSYKHSLANETQDRSEQDDEI
jgi:hypothetical protein